VDVHELELRKGECLASRLEIDLLPARHAARAGGYRQGLHHVELYARVIGKLVLGEQLKRQRLQCIAHEERGGFVVLDVHRRLATAQLVVIHAGKIVVHERVCVDQLDRRGGDLQPLGRRARHLAGCKRQQRAHALAALEGRVPHRLVQTLWRHVASR
jgi:hypothetical protein